VTEPAELTYHVLQRVALFVKSLPADQLEDLASGAAKLELVPRGGRAAPVKRAGAPLPRPADEILSTVRGTGDRRAARRYLEVDLKLTAAHLRELAKTYGVTVPAKATKPQVLNDLVEWAVGRAQDSSVF
jgi:hypothetical protein